MKIKLIDFGAKKTGFVGNRAHYNDAGFDVMCQSDFSLNPGETKAIGVGIGVEIPDGMLGWICPKSGLSSKRGIVSELAPIDSGYRGEIHAILHNQSSSVQSFKAGEKIGQLVIVPVVLTDYDWELDNSRGTGGFGSTGA